MKSGANRILTECAACLRVILDVRNLFRGFQGEVLMQDLTPRLRTPLESTRFARAPRPDHAPPSDPKVAIAPI